jgi:pimeloyl-[acyl-carrier protein] methyl ester esterase
LLLRGLGREQRHWGTFPDILGAEVKARRVFCLDMPGAGTEFGRDCPFTIEAITRDVRERWLTLQQEHSGPWGLLAISLGGMVAMHWCATYACDFERLVIVNSSASNLSHPLKRMSPEVIPDVVRAIFESDAVNREKRVLKITSRLADNHDVIARQWSTYGADHPVRRKNVLAQLYAASRFRAPERIDTPMLVLAGARDPLADPMCAYRLSRHFKAPLHIHPGAGHDLPLDDPRWLARQVRGWLEEETVAA